MNATIIDYVINFVLRSSLLTKFDQLLWLDVRNILTTNLTRLIEYMGYSEVAKIICPLSLQNLSKKKKVTNIKSKTRLIMEFLKTQYKT